eukprot:363625-Chlamydomonas_euryale.AAC.28
MGAGPLSGAGDDAITSMRRLADGIRLLRDEGRVEERPWVLHLEPGLRTELGCLQPRDLSRGADRRAASAGGQGVSGTGSASRDGGGSLRGWRALTVQRLGWPGPAWLCVTDANQEGTPVCAHARRGYAFVGLRSSVIVDL